MMEIIECVERNATQGVLHSILSHWVPSLLAFVRYLRTLFGSSNSRVDMTSGMSDRLLRTVVQRCRTSTSYISTQGIQTHPDV